MRTGNIQQASILKSQGTEYFKTGNYMDAAILYTQAIVIIHLTLQTLNESEATLYTNRSLCFEKMCQFREMESDARVAISLNPNIIKGYYLLGKALHHIGLANKNHKTAGYLREARQFLVKGNPSLFISN